MTLLETYIHITILPLTVFFITAHFSFWKRWFIIFFQTNHYKHTHIFYNDFYYGVCSPNILEDTPPLYKFINPHYCITTKVLEGISIWRRASYKQIN